MKMEHCSETSAYKIQAPANYPEESIQQQRSHFDINKICKLPSSAMPPTLITEAGNSIETLKLQSVKAQETQTLVVTL
jgi:hypothetical protein